MSDLAVVRRKTGELVECPACSELQDALLEAQDDLKKKKAECRRLKRDRQKEREDDPARQTILTLIERWKVKTGHPKSNANASDRFDLVKARLREGYSVEDLELAIDGIGAYPYVHDGKRVKQGAPHERHDGLRIALRGGENVERFANLGHHARKVEVVHGS